MLRHVVRRRVVLTLVLLALVAGLALTGLWRRLQGLIQPLTVPTARAVNGLSLNLGSLFSGPQLQRENNELRQRLAQLKAYESERDTLRLENEHLRNLTGLPLPPRFPPLGVEVIGRRQDETGTSYIINRGSRDGLVPGLALVAGVQSAAGQENRSTAVLVGTVRSVGQDISTFTIMTSTQSQVLAEVANATQSHGLAVGEYNLAVRLKFIPLTDGLSPGQAVVTSNLSPLIPPGLLLGSITAVERQPGDFFQSAVVAPPWALDRLRFLYVLLQPRAPT
ncbi:MAG: rod shape-determining protein MreC [Candidatus Kerfeldbacteria bacterium]|nr:rod shape-determining protein MreC [Candidatus Kerfeldbacteria bacterium]